MKKDCFTLAETLITVVIVGVVSALTIPNLIIQHQKEETATRLKQSYSILFQALKNAEVDYGSMNNWEIPNSTWKNSRDFAEKYLIPYIKIQKKCEKSSTECRPDKSYFLDGSTGGYEEYSGSMYQFVLINGAFVGVWTRGYEYLVELYLDINGKKKPNTWGKDVFVLVFLTPKAGGYFGKHNNAGLYFYGQGLTRNQLLTGTYPCAKRGGNAGVYCGALIQLDGWRIADDYPW